MTGPPGGAIVPAVDFKLELVAVPVIHLIERERDAMNLTVFGGTGGTGEQVIRAAMDAGHTVTAAARDPSRIRTPHELLRAVRADVLDRQSLDGTVDGADAVVSALGVPSGRDPTTVYSTGVANILDAMRRAACGDSSGSARRP